ncbi:hypothetical protein BOTBODRAFT_36382 [Botryobasidium botryosum FD-172 SS1]|uniref:Uncharacterized protein n=1 Tax=Botryobasidium botryosum (strain FD-172 SS1) TaxID=930990 RepID=A0A067M6E3_BOTB1|nr:hypothetical protein BOTBODRAFT_36382 [Botryobasidium botryosum FD-172 SS1]
MSMSSKAPSPKPATDQSRCRLAEIVQYQCELVSRRVVCTPIPRIFLEYGRCCAYLVV